MGKKEVQSSASSVISRVSRAHTNTRVRPVLAHIMSSSTEQHLRQEKEYNGRSEKAARAKKMISTLKWKTLELIRSTLILLARRKSSVCAGVTFFFVAMLLISCIRRYHVQTEEEEESCFRPIRRINNVVATSPLSRPFINLGMPKMGSTSLHSYFRCGGYTSVHWVCGPNGTFCGDCIEESIKAGLPPLSKCPTVDSYSQIDKGPENMPQVNYLEEIVGGIPNATYILTFRNMTKWYISMSNWLGIAGKNKTNNMKARFQRSNITGLPPGAGNNVSEFRNFYCEYVKRVRKTIAKYPGHMLIEIDIEDPTEGWRLEEAFGVNHTCWGKTNIRVSNDTVSFDELH